MYRRRNSFPLIALSLSLGAICILVPTLLAAKAQTLEELKARVTSAEVHERPKLCVEIAQKQLANYEKLYAANDMNNARQALGDVITYSELARDYSIKTKKREKQTEIAVRNMARRLSDLKHTVAFADEAAIQDALNRLQRVRDDLLGAMFPKAQKEADE